jgi:hypothetical protein
MKHTVRVDLVLWLADLSNTSPAFILSIEISCKSIYTPLYFESVLRTLCYESESNLTVILFPAH